MTDRLRDAIVRLEGIVADLRSVELTGPALAAEPAADPQGSDLSGLWTGKVVEADTYEVVLQLQQAGARLRGSIVVYYDDPDEPYLACQQADGEIDGDRVTVRGTDVMFIPADPEADYGLDVFEMRLANQDREMSGRWTDADGDADGRVVVRRAFG